MIFKDLYNIVKKLWFCVSVIDFVIFGVIFTYLYRSSRSKRRTKAVNNNVIIKNDHKEVTHFLKGLPLSSTILQRLKSVFLFVIPMEKVSQVFLICVTYPASIYKFIDVGLVSILLTLLFWCFHY